MISGLFHVLYKVGHVLKGNSMLEKIVIGDVTGVPYLKGSTLAKTHKKGITLSSNKVNVLVGPNGSGKSALLKALALKTLSFYTGSSALDGKYIVGTDSKGLWSDGDRWSSSFEFMPGLSLSMGQMRGIYFKPSHIPGDDNCVTSAMMCGYFEEAKRYGKLTENKSSGEQGRAVLQSVWSLLKQSRAQTAVPRFNWKWGDKLDENPTRTFSNELTLKANTLKKWAMDACGNGTTLCLFDEPEQSLDAEQEALLWKKLLSLDTSQVQVLVATHSWYPYLFPEKFHLIESVSGHAAAVRKLLA